MRSRRARVQVLLPWLAVVTSLAACTPQPGWIEPGTCFAPVNQSWPDVRYVGPEGAVDNLEVYSSHDGTCTGLVAGPPDQRLMQAPDQQAAAVRCSALLGAPSSIAFPLGAYFTGMPADAWVCGRSL